MSLFHKDDKSAYENYHLCHKCKGKCCKYSPCLVDKEDINTSSPMDIATSVVLKDFAIRTLTNASGYHVMDYFDFPYLYVSSGALYEPCFSMLGIPNVCKNLTDKGCKFNSKERPKGGRLLIPQKDFKCTYEDTSKIFSIVTSWMNLQDDLKEAVELITGSKIDFLVDSQYKSIKQNYDDYLGDQILSTPARDFARSYFYCKLVNDYGIHVSPQVMDHLDFLIQKGNSTGIDIKTYLISVLGEENVSDAMVESLVSRKIL